MTPLTPVSNNAAALDARDFPTDPEESVEFGALSLEDPENGETLVAGAFPEGAEERPDPFEAALSPGVDDRQRTVDVLQLPDVPRLPSSDGEAFSSIPLPDPDLPYARQAAVLHDFAATIRGADGYPTYLDDAERSSLRINDGFVEFLGRADPRIADQWSDLRPEEKVVLDTRFQPTDFFTLASNRDQALSQAERFYPHPPGGERDDDKSNALQHVYRSALDTMSFGASRTNDLHTAHEYPQFLDGSTATSNRDEVIVNSTQDLANNAVGRAIAQEAAARHPFSESMQRQAALHLSVQAVEDGRFGDVPVIVNDPGRSSGNELAEPPPELPFSVWRDIL